jgi:hypothetical protein
MANELTAEGLINKSDEITDITQSYRLRDVWKYRIVVDGIEVMLTMGCYRHRDQDVRITRNSVVLSDYTVPVDQVDALVEKIRVKSLEGLI